MTAVLKFPACCFLLFLFLIQSGSAYSTIAADTTARQFIIENITLIGNKSTKDRILFRELTFQKGDTVDTASMNSLAKRSEENLTNTSLFNSVNVSWIAEGQSINVFILVTERWYIFPLPIFEIAERNFNVWWETKDYSRLIYGGVLTWNNFRGRKEELAVTVRLGYTQRISFFYSIPFINKQQKSGLTFGFAYSRNHQSSVNTIDNKITYYKNDERFARKEHGAYAAYTYRPDLYNTHLIETGYRHAQVLDSVITLNSDYFTRGESRMSYAILRYFFKSDHRDIAVYPLKGHYLDFEIVKNGFSFLYDDVDLAYLTARAKKFWQLSKKFYFGSGATVKHTAGGNVPYFLSRGLGYGREFIRGYEFYVIDGTDFALLKTNLKFEMVPKKKIHLGFVPLTKFSTIPYAFYLNLHSDYGYVWGKQFVKDNPLNNSLQIGYGGGIDFVTYYDLVFRLEYSINKLGESGIFLHFTSPI